LPQRLLLLYSNRRPEGAAFLAELQQLEQQNKKSRLVATMTEMSKSSRQWEGETGFMNEDLVKGETYFAEHALTGRQVEMILSGSLLNLMRKRSG
jgi:ferredoxin-NADP reductase